MLRLLFNTSAVFILIASSNANSQNIPSTTEPAKVEQGLNERRPYIDNSKIFIPDLGRSNKTPDGAEEILFTLKSLVTTGSTVFSNDELTQHYEEYLNQKIPLSKIYDIANKITNMYLESGYTLSFALVPVQTIDDGVVKIKVIEGYISEMIIDGKYAGSKGILNKWKSVIESQRPTKGNLLVDALITIKRLPGTDATVLLEKSEKEGASVLRFVMNHKYIEGTVEANNFGSRYVGPYLNQNSFNFNSLFGLSDRISISNSQSVGDSELYSNSIGFSIPINYKGTTISTTISNSTIEPGFNLESTSVDSESYTTELGINHPFILGEDRQLELGLSFNTYNSQTDILGQPNSQDRIRSAKLSGDYFQRGAGNSYSFARLEYSRGFDVLNSSDPSDPLLSRSGGRSDFSKLNAYIEHSRYLRPNVNLFISASGQWSETNLLSSEEFSFGGRAFGRGYNFSEFNGDSGIANSIELTYIGQTSNKYLPKYQFYSFYDWAMLWDIDSSGTDDRKSAASTGLGLKLPVIKDLILQLELAKPLTRPASSRGEKDDDDFQVLFSIKKKFEYTKK